MQIVPRAITIAALEKLRQTNPTAADLLSLNQLHQAIEHGTVAVMNGPDAPQPQHAKILAAAAQVVEILRQHENSHSPIAGQQAAVTVRSLTQQLWAAFADTDPIALSQMRKQQ